jgi:hypothetical protein
MSHVGIRFGSHLPCQELEAAEFLTSWDTPTAGLGYVLEMRQKVGNCSKSRFSTVKSGFQQKTAHNQVLDPRPDFSWDMGLQGIYIYMVGNYMWNIPLWWVIISDNHMYSIVDDNHYNHYPMIMDIVIIIIIN